MTAKRLWIVEDNPADLFLINIALDRTERAWERTVISDGEEASRKLELCAAGKLAVPDLLLLDLHLPKVRGADLLRLVQSDRRLSLACVGILSSLLAPGADIQLRPSDRYIQKSAILSEFIADINAWVASCPGSMG